jgi:hypothetical protein
LLAKPGTMAAPVRLPRWVGNQLVPLRIATQVVPQIPWTKPTHHTASAAFIPLPHDPLLRSRGAHALFIDHVAPQTRLLEKRRQMFEVQEALDAQKEEFARREEAFKRREEGLRKKDLDLQEALIRFNQILTGACLQREASLRAIPRSQWHERQMVATS